jgi:hypothetical protein
MIFGFTRNMLFSLAASAALAAFAVQAQTPPRMKMTTDIPASITTPDKVETRLGTLKFFDGFPDDPTVEKLYDNLDFERGVQAFLTALPGASVYGLREGFRSQGATDNQTVLITENLMDSKSLFLTSNTETVYNLMWLDLKYDPLVIGMSGSASFHSVRKSCYATLALACRLARRASTPFGDLTEIKTSLISPATWICCSGHCLDSTVIVSIRNQ